MSLPQPLMFTVGLIDQITKPIAKISHSLNGLSSDYQTGTMKMASGVAGIAGSGYALQNALMPAIEMDRVLGEVKSLGVRESALKQLTDTSYQYALKYGKSATEFVSSSYDIQSAIAGLNDADLSAFTMSSNVLAAATKSDAATITNYMGTMYGIFKNQAETMGKSAWVEQITGMTAQSVQAFKTTGSEMSAAFTSLGADANSAGIAVNEQMAILGTLQATMSGSEAGTKYSAFLAGVGKAQSALGLTFTDSQGRMLPMVDILTEIRGKYGDVIDVAEGDQLAKAFGSKNAVSTIKLLLTDINGLNDSINSLGQVTGMQKAEEMAMAMTDQSERLAQSWYVIRVAWGAAILPAFNDFVGKIADMGSEVIWFTEMFPELTKYIGYAAVGVLGLVAAVGLLTAISGLFTIIASPLILISAGVSAVIAGVYLLFKYFGQIKAFLGTNDWGLGILDSLETIMETMRDIGDAVMYAYRGFSEMFISIMPALKVLGAILGFIFSRILSNAVEHFSDIFWLIGQIFSFVLKVAGVIYRISADIANFANGLFGEEIEVNSKSIPAIEAIAPLEGKTVKGGITQQISNANQQKSTSVGTVNVYPAKGDSSYMNFVEMHS